MITGFNTDIEFDGIVYHVQTEDKGVDSPLILTLVYSGGAILASKRVLYDDLLESGFDEAILAERLGRQHKLICAAVNAGRLDDLKRMSQRDAVERTARANQPIPGAVHEAASHEEATHEEEAEDEEDVDLSFESEDKTPIAEVPVERVPEVERTPEIVHENPPTHIEDMTDAHVAAGGVSSGGYAGVFEQGSPSKDGKPGIKPYLELLNERQYRAGESVTLKIRLHGSAADGSKNLSQIQVGVKILGTNFRPIILLAKTDRDGLATIEVLLPVFTSGRAAILIRAAIGSETVELRRMIHHG